MEEKEETWLQYRLEESNSRELSIYLSRVIFLGIRKIGVFVVVLESD